MDLLNARTACRHSDGNERPNGGVYVRGTRNVRRDRLRPWESKYAYNPQVAPSERDHKLAVALPVPNSPS
jgi:hypothetical protein